MAGRRVFRNPFAAAPPLVGAEQLRMLFASAPFSFTLGAIASMLVAGVLTLRAPGPPLILWGLLSWLPVPAFSCLAHAFARAASPLEVTARYTRWVTLTCTATGALRGALPWIAFHRSEPLTIAMLVCFMVAIQAGAMVFMAPVLPAFAGYTSAFIVLFAIKLAMLGDPIYWAIGAGSVLFGIGVIGSAIRLSASFRSMVELRFENLDLVARLRGEAAIAEAARSDAEEANQAKLKFLAAASHDLRQPIHAQGLFLEALSHSPLTALQREVLENARTACAASRDMLNTLLDFSRLEAGTVTVNVRPFRLQPLLNRIENELAPLADGKGLVYRTRDTEAIIDSDMALVELILRNLVSNAIRYTDQGGILIGCRGHRRSVRVEVWDTGIGIEQRHHAAIFDEFHQIGNPERDRRKGLGLGLAIVDRLAITLGHEVALRSRPGRGSVFSVVLPLAAGAAAHPPEPRNEGVNLARLRTLVIDDDESVREGMRHLLASWGVSCAAVESIDEALAMAADLSPQLVICDYRMREQRTGIQAIAMLRERNPNLPAVLITGDTAPERLREAQASGLPILHKPIDPQELRRKIHETIAPWHDPFPSGR